MDIFRSVTGSWKQTGVDITGGSDDLAFGMNVPRNQIFVVAKSPAYRRIERLIDYSYQVTHLAIKIEIHYVDILPGSLFFSSSLHKALLRLS